MKNWILRKKIKILDVLEIFSFSVPEKMKEQIQLASWTAIVMLPHDGQGFYLDFWGYGYTAESNSALFQDWNFISYTT